MQDVRRLARVRVLVRELDLRIRFVLLVGRLIAALGEVALNSPERRLAIRLRVEVLGVHTGHMATVAGDVVGLCRRVRRRELSIAHELAPLERIGWLPLLHACLRSAAIRLCHLVLAARQEARVPERNERTGP